MKVQITKETMQALGAYDQLLERAAGTRNLYVAPETRRVLAGLYARIVGNDQACKSCNNAWIKRLSGWYILNKEEKQNKVKSKATPREATAANNKPAAKAVRKRVAKNKKEND